MLKKNQTIKKFLVSYVRFLVLILITLFSKTSLAYGIDINWVEISKTPAGIQYLDKESLKIKGKGIIEIKTKYLKIDKYNSNETEENIYLMKINCSTNEFKDISVNGKKNLTAKWEGPNGDKLLDDAIINSCKTFYTNSLQKG
tara:strand:- start:1179 stop:1607 length:429 start_codon:yes stop_codon:yes gene_type:complete